MVTEQAMTEDLTALPQGLHGTHKYSGLHRAVGAAGFSRVYVSTATVNSEVPLLSFGGLSGFFLKTLLIT
jgi:hypothetical protein